LHGEPFTSDYKRSAAPRPIRAHLAGSCAAVQKPHGAEVARGDRHRMTECVSVLYDIQVGLGLLRW